MCAHTHTNTQPQLLVGSHLVFPVCFFFSWKELSGIYKHYYMEEDASKPLIEVTSAGKFSFPLPPPKRVQAGLQLLLLPSPQANPLSSSSASALTCSQSAFALCRPDLSLSSGSPARCGALPFLHKTHNRSKRRGRTSSARSQRQK